MVQKVAEIVFVNAMNKKGWVITEDEEYSFTARYYSGQQICSKPPVPIADCEVWCKWDGCMIYRQFSNGDDSGSDENTDSIHICSQDELVKQLTELRKLRIDRKQELS